MLDPDRWNAVIVQCMLSNKLTNFLFLRRSVKDGVDGILDKVYGPFKNELKKNFEAGFKNLRENEDKYSTRGKLATLNYDYFTIQWLETNSTYEHLLLSNGPVDEKL